MYTVKELIEALQQCPENYEVRIGSCMSNPSLPVEAVGIDPENETVDLFVI